MSDNGNAQCCPELLQASFRRNVKVTMNRFNDKKNSQFSIMDEIGALLVNRDYFSFEVVSENSSFLATRNFGKN